MTETMGKLRTSGTSTSRIPRRPAVTLAVSALAVVTALSAFVNGQTPAHAEGWDEVWLWPTGSPVAVTRQFDPPSMPWLSGHRGVDLEAPVGSTISAPAAGTVIFSGKIVDRQVVSVMHEGGLRSTYEPVIPLVETGQNVMAGEPIATIDAGHSPGPLHWGARFGKNEYVNPLRMLTGPSVLKPWD